MGVVRVLRPREPSVPNFIWDRTRGKKAGNRVQKRGFFNSAAMRRSAAHFGICIWRRTAMFGTLSSFPNMNVVVESLPNCLATLRVEVDPERVSATRERVTREFGSAVRIPGYRPGKAPRAVVEKNSRSRSTRSCKMKPSWTDTTSFEAILEKKLRVLQLAHYDDIEFGEDDRLNFTATVVTEPEFPLPNYKGLIIRALPLEVEEAEIDASLESLRDQGADFQDITGDRGAEMGDFLVIDYTGTIDGTPVHEVFPKAGRPLSGNDDFWIKMTDEAFFPGYCKALLGSRPGDARSFDIEVPSDFPVEGMPGKTVHYEVKVKAIKQKILPELAIRN